MHDRRLEVFFYGLFMDPTTLEGKGIQPRHVRLASVSGHKLRIGTRAALVPTDGEVVHGVLMKLSHADLETLYSESGVRAYRPEPVLAIAADGTRIAALCYNLPEPPDPEEHDADYAAKLRALAQRLGLPPDYVGTIR